jgi:hypothetical protein
LTVLIVPFDAVFEAFDGGTKPFGLFTSLGSTLRFICSFNSFSLGIPGIGGVFFGCVFFKSSALGMPGVVAGPFGTVFALIVFGSGIPGVAAVEFVVILFALNSGGRFAGDVVAVVLVAAVLLGALAVVHAKEIAAIEITETKLKLRNIELTPEI